MKTQSGCFCREEHLASGRLAELARQALKQDQRPSTDAALYVTPSGTANVVRVAFDVPKGAKVQDWTSAHRKLAQLLSDAGGSPVHAYLLMPWDGEEVETYAGGKRVGGERVRYAFEEPEDEDVSDDAHFAKLQESWPLGRLARVLGLRRTDLLRMARSGRTTRQPL